ncbi:PLP-dependent transferase, partial [Corynespora cassiicola Philippines]
TLIHPSDLTVANGCSSLFNMLGLTLGDPGDGILLTQPSYVAFPTDLGLLAKMQPIFVPFATTDQFSPTVLPHYEHALKEAIESGTQARALMLCNPHNPLGRCYPPETLIALLTFCNKYSIHLIVDEIYAQSVYDSGPGSPPFTSVLSLDWEKQISKAYLHVLYGMSKDFASDGLRIGCLWTRNEELARAVSALSGFHWPGAVDERVAVAMLEDERFIEEFLALSRSRLKLANVLARELLDGEGIRYMGGSNAGFFLWVDLSPYLRQEDGKDGWAREDRLMQRLLDAKVFLTRGQGQSSKHPGWFRFVFSHRGEVLREGVLRLKQALGKGQNTSRVEITI